MILRWVITSGLAVGLALALGAAAAASEHRAATTLAVTVDGEARLGATVTATARLTDAAGRPVKGAEVAFRMPAEWGETRGAMLLGSARTDTSGAVRLPVRLRVSGEVEIVARFEGDEQLEPATATAELTVEGNQQLYEPQMPSVSTIVGAAGSWFLAALLATVWGLYFFVARLVLRIASASDDAIPASAPLGRRRLLGLAVPAGMHALVAPVGLGLVTVIARSPYTHTNLEGHSLTRCRGRAYDGNSSSGNDRLSLGALARTRKHHRATA